MTWNWQERPDEPRTWTNAAERLISLDCIDGAGGYRAGESLQRALDAGAVAVVRCTAEQLSERRTWHRSVIPAGFARIQAELDAVVAELLRVDAACRALWLEPMEDLNLDRALGVLPPGMLSFMPLDHVDWIVVDGGCDPLHPAHVRSIRDQCAAAGVPFSFRSWGEWCPRDYRIHGMVPTDPVIRINERGLDATRLENVDDSEEVYMQRVGRERSGALLDGCLHDERPEVAR